MTVSNPKVNLQIKGAQVPVTVDQQKILYIAQKTASGTAVSGDLNKNLQTGREYETLFGKDSMLSPMVRAAQVAMAVSPTKPRLDAIAFDDNGAATAATGNVTFANTSATADATIYVTIASDSADTELNHRYQIDVSATTPDTGDDVGAALLAFINNDERIPVTATNTNGDVALTAINKGLAGNKITLRVEGSIPGIVISTTVMSGGTNDPDISSVETTIENIRYQRIVMPATYDVTAIVSFLETRFNITDPIIKDGELIIVDTDTHANFLSSTVAENKKTATIFPNKLKNTALHKGSVHIELDYVIAAQIAALSALRLTEGAEIADIVDAAVEADDNFGGISLATLPYHNTPLTLVPLADEEDVWTNEELTELKDAGYAIFGNNEANQGVILGKVLTRYQTNTEGQPDVSFKYLNYVDQAVNSREYMTDSLKTRFRQSRATSGALIPGKTMANEGVIRAEVMLVYGELVDFALMVGGEAARKKFADKLEITIDEANSKATLKMINPAVTQLNELDGIIQTTFTI